MQSTTGPTLVIDFMDGRRIQTPTTNATAFSFINECRDSKPGEFLMLPFTPFDMVKREAIALVSILKPGVDPSGRIIIPRG